MQIKIEDSNDFFHCYPQHKQIFDYTLAFLQYLFDFSWLHFLQSI